jgi:hypothetical protein
MIANIALDDGLILPHVANPTGSNFRERASGMETGALTPSDVWRRWADNVRGFDIASGHLLPEQAAGSGTRKGYPISRCFLAERCKYLSRALQPDKICGRDRVDLSIVSRVIASSTNAVIDAILRLTGNP